MENSRLDIVIFGASGFTGKYTVEETVKLSKEIGFSWGIAGRNQDKLKNTLKSVGLKLGENLNNIPIILADVNDDPSLNNMAMKAKVVANCCGPYRFFGEQVVKACIANGTHHVDVSGEPQYMEKVQLNYHEDAKNKNAYVISACGFDSIPADMGVVFLKNKFQGDVNCVEAYLTMISPIAGGPSIHYGTWESAIYGLAHSNELRPLRQKLYPNALPKFSPRLKPRSALHRNEDVEGWCLPFLGSDRAVVMRSQRFFYETENQRPIQIFNYFTLPSLLICSIVIFAGMIFSLLARWKCGRSLLLKYPRFFSFGFISHEGPSEEKMNNTKFKCLLIGQGWKERLTEPTDNHKEPMNKKMVVKVTGTNPGYGATCVALILCAVTILKESDRMPNTGGVYPPGAAFAKTSLVENLHKHGIAFEVVTTEEK